MKTDLKNVAELVVAGKEDEAEEMFHKLVIEKAREIYEDKIAMLDVFVTEKLTAELIEFAEDKKRLHEEHLRLKAVIASYTTHNEEKN